MDLFELALQDVRSVRNGHVAGGSSRLQRTVSYTDQPDVLRAVGSLVSLVYTTLQLNTPATLDNADARTAIVFKVLAHLSKTGRTRSAQVHELGQETTNFAWMAIEKPELITSAMNFAGIVRCYHQAIREYQLEVTRKKRPPLLVGIPPRPVHWRSPCGQYRLEELNHPLHLVMESRALSHCLGRFREGWHPQREKEYERLPYWRRIANKRSRIYSFGRERPLCTLHIKLQPAALVEAGLKYSGTLTSSERFFPALVLALEYLATTFNGTLRFDHGLSLGQINELTKRQPRTLENEFRWFIQQRRKWPQVM